MKRFVKLMFRNMSILTIAFLFGAVSLTALGQATGISEEEFEKETDKALKTAEMTFPRRETESKPNKTKIFKSGKGEPLETILSQRTIKEFLAGDKIRYEFITITSKNKTITKRMLIGSQCYQLGGKTWENIQLTCDPQTYRIGDSSSKVEFFDENGTLDSKPVKILRNINTGKVYSDGKPPYISEYLYYMDSAGRLIKTEYLTRQGEEKSNLENSTIYEYDVKIEPIIN